MSEHQDQSQESADEEIPPGLAAELSRLDRTVAVPDAIDSAILARARAEYERRMRFRPIIRFAVAAAAFAAGVAIVFVVKMALVHPPRNLARGDIDGNGTVDMLDAYVLAKKLASGAKPEPAWDVNGDGVVDQNDVDWIARAAVSLDHVATGGKTP